MHEWIRNIRNGERIEVSVIPKLSDRQDEVVELGEFNNVDANRGEYLLVRLVYLNDDISLLKLLIINFVRKMEHKNSRLRIKA